jgi:hypothetical protein
MMQVLDWLEPVKKQAAAYYFAHRGEWPNLVRAIRVNNHSETVMSQ